VRALGIIVVTLSLLAAGSSTASAAVDLVETDVTLPVHGSTSHAAVTDMLVDAAHGHIFLTSAPSRKIVEVSDTGQILKKVTVTTGTGGMALVGNALYVGSCLGRTITIFSASTFTQTGSFKVASGQPCLLAAIAGRLWFTASPLNSPLESVSLGATHRTISYPMIPAGHFAVRAPSTLYTISYTKLSKIDVSGATPVVTSQAMVSNSTDVEVAPDGSRVVATGGSGGASIFDADLNPVSTLGDSAYTAAYSPDGAWLALQSSLLTVYPAATSSPRLTVLNNSINDGTSEQAHHVQFSTDSSQIYTVSDGGTPTLRIIDIPASSSYASYTGLGDPTLALGQSFNSAIVVSTFPMGGETGRSVTAVLTDPQGNDVEGTLIYATVSGSQFLKTPALGLTGAWHLDVTVAESGLYRAVTTHSTILVTGTPTVVTLRAHRTTTVYGVPDPLTAHLSTYTGGVTQVRIHRAVGGVDTVIGSGAVDANGNLVVTVKPNRETHYWAEHQSDDTYSIAQSSPLPVFVVPVIEGAFTSKHSTSGRYALFTYHASCASSGSKCPLFTEHVRPSTPGTKVQMIVQQYTSRGWKSVAAWSHRLNRYSRWTFKIRYLNASVINQRYRIIATSNLTSVLRDSAWGYWYFQIRR
jgi:hypothetical protein